MSRSYDINTSGHNNNAFQADDEKTFTPAVNSSSKHQHQQQQQYGIEMSEKKPTGLNSSGSSGHEYDPYKMRNVEHPTSNMDTLIHLLKGSLGTGILAMPNAFHNSGYVVGAIGTVVIGMICTYCIHLLIKAEYELCKRKKVPSMSYPGVAEAALMEGPNWAKVFVPYVGHIINTFLLIYQLGTCCVYVVFVSSNIKSIVDYYTGEPTDVRLFMLIILLPLILINWVRNLKYLAPFSTLANAITMVSFGIISYYIFREPLSLENREPVGELKNFPLYFGTVLFALEAIGVMLPLENEMKTPKAFGGFLGVLNQGMVVIVLLYVGMGLFGYLNYGAEIHGSITLNLPADDILAQSVKGMLALAIFITHGLACYVAIDITWTDYVVQRIGNSPRKVFWEYAVRTGLVLITFLLAVAIPNLELFISLFGALCLSALGLAFPAMIEMFTHWKFVSGGRKVRMVLVNSVIILVGIAGLIIGTYTSLSEIIKTFFVEEEGSKGHH